MGITVPNKVRNIPGIDNISGVKKKSSLSSVIGIVLGGAVIIALLPIVIIVSMSLVDVLTNDQESNYTGV